MELLMQKGDLKIFTKSGNEVRLVKRHDKDSWVVERTKGQSKGKQMLCNECALMDEEVYKNFTWY